MNDTLTAIMEKPDVPFGTPGFCYEGAYSMPVTL